jgi:hypothetical protein
MPSNLLTIDFLLYKCATQGTINRATTADYIKFNYSTHQQINIFKTLLFILSPNFYILPSFSNPFYKNFISPTP